MVVRLFEQTLKRESQRAPVNSRNYCQQDWQNFWAGDISLLASSIQVALDIDALIPHPQMRGLYKTHQHPLWLGPDGQYRNSEQKPLQRLACVRCCHWCKRWKNELRRPKRGAKYGLGRVSISQRIENELHAVDLDARTDMLGPYGPQQSQTSINPENLTPPAENTGLQIGWSWGNCRSLRVR